MGVRGVSGDTSRPDNIVFDITSNLISLQIHMQVPASVLAGLVIRPCLNTSGSNTLTPVQP
jgi:hypothetical protein